MNPSITKRTWLLHSGWVVAVVLFILSACGRGNPPEGLLDKEEMIQAMIQLYVVEEKASHLSLNRDSTKQVVDSLSQRLFADLHISDSIFKESLDFYWKDPASIDKIYEAIIDSLNLREQRFTLAEEAKEKAEKEAREKEREEKKAQKESEEAEQMKAPAEKGNGEPAGEQEEKEVREEAQ